MPNISDILQSVQVPQLILDPFISNGTPIRDNRNRPIHYSGGFAVVFPFDINGEKWAFRCWSADLGNIERRLRTLSSGLTSVNLPYFCDFTYEPEGVVVDGKKYPTTRMRWIDGLNIKDYICKYKADSDRLKSLADSFMGMCKSLHNHKIAHGDLQHGNILVDDNGKLYLIDYDSVYLPTLNGEGDIIAGLPDYQHPNRRDNKIASEKMDYFSELVIYTSILAVSKDPSLVDKYDLENSDKMLFSTNDYSDIKESVIYSQLYKMGDDFKMLLNILETYLSKNDINDLEPFEILYDRLSKDPQIISFGTEKEISYEDEEVVLIWSVDAASKVEIDGVDVTGRNRLQKKCNKGQHSFKLTIYNGLKSTSSTCKHIVVPTPSGIFASDKLKCRKGKDTEIELQWDIENASSVKLSDGSKDYEIQDKGNLKIGIEKTTKYTLYIIGLDKKRVFTKELIVEVFEESKISFAVNRQYSLPTVPITLSWEVSNAKKVSLDTSLCRYEVAHEGTKQVVTDKDTVYKLVVEDEFEPKEESITIRMLPLPAIKTITVPTPDIVRTLNLNIEMPSIDIQLNIPQIKIQSVDLKMPFVKSLKELDTDVKLKHFTIERLGAWAQVKNLFDKYFNRK